MKFKRNFNLYIGVFLVTILLFLMIVSLFYTPYDINEMVIKERFQGPSIKHLMGTDNFGRDVLSRIIKGAQTAFLVGTVSVGVSFLFGTVIGAIAGYIGGWVDEIIMRFIDALMAFPSILLALVFIAVFGASTQNTIIAIGIRGIPTFARIARSGFMQYKEFEFVKAAKSIGAGHLRIMFIHILPNVLSPLIIAASMGFANAVLAEAGLSYLGLGVQPPEPSWGRMLKEAQNYIVKAPWYTLAPGIMITMSVLGFNLLGDGIRDMRDPRE
ncbi:MAG: ABC transporter permease [Marinisporobacter sp.]|jgi:peptide/nickel transport system permease protein|nr:ABC transporter permease [Marinisporobacter sp.]